MPQNSCAARGWHPGGAVSSSAARHRHHTRPDHLAASDFFITSAQGTALLELVDRDGALALVRDRHAEREAATLEMTLDTRDTLVERLAD